MPIVEITDVKVNSAKSDDLVGYYLDLPRPGNESDIYAVDVSGWVLGKSSPVVGIEFRSEGLKLLRIPLNTKRQDIVKHFSQVHHAEASGFKARVNILTLEQEFAIDVVAHLDNTKEIPIGTICGRRQSLNTGYQPTLSPLMVTTLRRTGSTWLLQLLNVHPQIIAYRPFEYEPRVGSYWIEILKAISDPSSYLQVLSSYQSDANWWLGNSYFPLEAMAFDPSIQRWIGNNNIGVVASFCQGRIEAFYEQVATIQKKIRPVYFAEKFSARTFITSLMWELYPNTKEIILVRDFRDMFCSVLSYNKKRGVTSFGRELTSGDEDYVRYLKGGAQYLRDLWKRQTPKVHLLRYEDLVMQPVEALKAMFEYLQVDCDEGLARQIMMEGETKNRDQQQLHQTASSPLTSIGRWQEELSKQLQDLCNETFGDILNEFGYNV